MFYCFISTGNTNLGRMWLVHLLAKRLPGSYTATQVCVTEKGPENLTSPPHSNLLTNDKEFNYQQCYALLTG